MVFIIRRREAMAFGAMAAALAMARGATGQTIPKADVTAPKWDIEKGASLKLIRPARFVEPDEVIFRFMREPEQRVTALLNGEIQIAMNVLPNLAGRSATEAGSAPGLTPQGLGTIEGTGSTTLSIANLPPQRLTLLNGTMSLVGGDQPFSLQQPTLGLHYIVAVQGLFPRP